MTVTDASILAKTNRRAVVLAEKVLDLREPWRSRFIDLICDYSFIEPSDQLTGEEIAQLLENRALYSRVRSMLRVWTPQ
jgi:hypothetical protein